MLGRCQVGSAEFQQGEPGSNVATRRKPSDNLAVACPRTVKMNTPKVARAHFRPCANAGATTRGRTKARKRADTGDRAWLLVGWGRELGGKVLALIDLLLGSAARNLKTPHTRTKASAWGEGRSKLGLGTLRAETAPIKQMRRPFLGTFFSGDTTAGIERPRGALGVAGGAG